MTDAPLLAWPQIVPNGARSRINRRIHTHECQALRQADGRRDAHPVELRDLTMCEYCAGTYAPAEVEQDHSLHHALRAATPGGDG